MSSLSIPSLKLFPLYTGGPILNGSNGLNQNSSFVIPATRYSQSYAVNKAPTTDPYDPNNYLAFNASNPRYLTSKPISDATDFTNMLGLDNSVPGHLAQVSAPATAPNIPKVFQNRVDNYTISDANYAALMTQASFEIPGIGMGLLVTTDGSGNVQSESINPSSWSTMIRTNAVGNDLGVLNRAEITLGATYKVDDPGYTFSNIDHKNPTTALNQKAPQTPSAVGAMGSPNLLQSAGIFNTQPLNPAATTGLGDLTGVNAANPILAKLNQLQPQDIGLSLSGQEAGIDTTQAQQVAVGQADYGVNLSSNFYQNMASVVNTANSQQQSSYAATYAPQMDQIMNGRIYVPHGGGYGHMPASANQGAASVNNQVTFNIGAAVSDATAGNSRNGYIPFNMQNGGASTGGGGFSDPNPFAGNSGSQGGFQGRGYSGGGGNQSGQQPPYYRKPLAYTA